MKAGSEPPLAIATERTPGIDVARALAVLGMVLVNYAALEDVADKGPDWVVWLFNRLEGRAGSLFVLLAGIGVSLRTRKAREQAPHRLGLERRALLKRAAILFVVGLLNLHLWEWDILHCYGLYLALAALLLGASSHVLWATTVTCVLAAAGLQLGLNYEAQPPPWSLGGMTVSLLFNGLYPAFPWLAFLLVGMHLGRLDLRDARVRRRVLAVALATAAIGEAVSAATDPIAGWFGLTEDSAVLLGSWPRPPTPSFVLGAGGTAVAVICVCVGVTQPRPNTRWVVALTATGQMAFTLYVAHALAILIPDSHGWLEHLELPGMLAWGFAFYAGAVLASLWWRRRWARGPLEALIRQITGRTEPAPWGGALVTDPLDDRLRRAQDLPSPRR